MELKLSGIANKSSFVIGENNETLKSPKLLTATMKLSVKIILTYVSLCVAVDGKVE